MKMPLESSTPHSHVYHHSSQFWGNLENKFLALRIKSGKSPLPQKSQNTPTLEARFHPKGGSRMHFLTSDLSPAIQVSMEIFKKGEWLEKEIM